MEQKKYTNGEVTILWQPKLCIHAAFCAKELPAVFKPKDKPWIQPENASTADIVNQVKRCPSGALSYYMNTDEYASTTE
ncbi:(4Fe-4S)-binding protein [Flavobacterium aurantiibacter]|uniref:(4Fe-4S)-binding protein n=1 Tax=Flavobacterium aurantiibacter TaxID=2023067 RepID=A0A255ZQT4_9FLAO|nr:(4Fe-4S)-binding protein [Flavobacterium aurantiibacter]OYQ43781.1 (4Fe-4S)-binding protein [Flavobacterium aurantiibacter]